MGTLIWIIIAVAVLVGAAFFAKWIIESFIKMQPLQTILMVAVGVVLLIVLLIGVAQLVGSTAGTGISIGPSPFHR